jgi:hypothetical protein
LSSSASETRVTFVNSGSCPCCRTARTTDACWSRMISAGRLGARKKKPTLPFDVRAATHGVRSSGFATIPVSSASSVEAWRRSVSIVSSSPGGDGSSFPPGSWIKPGLLVDADIWPTSRRSSDAG